MGACDADGRLPLSRMTGWEIFPFEPGGLRVVPLAPPELPEPDRHGEGGQACGGCQPADHAIWSDEHWRLTAFEESGAPLVLMLQPAAHHDLTDLPDDLASEMGKLIVHLGRAIEALPNVARVHVSKWGDGGAHLHLFFYARPAGFPQLRGTCLAVWDDLLPAVPEEFRRADATAVAQALVASYGGSVRH
jgi:diadenosine tetraphosphate (Ap4A) HIT family hydrolase